jgi:hypothetical protein
VLGRFGRAWPQPTVLQISADMPLTCANVLRETIFPHILRKVPRGILNGRRPAKRPGPRTSATIRTCQPRPLHDNNPQTVIGTEGGTGASAHDEPPRRPRSRLAHGPTASFMVGARRSSLALPWGTMLGMAGGNHG